MIGLKDFLSKAKAGFPSLEIKYLHPSIYVVVICADFEGLQVDQREALFFARARIDAEEALLTRSANNLSLCLCTDEERIRDLDFLEDAPLAHHWVEFLVGAEKKSSHVSPIELKLIHFYGFKGGQGRSTVLTMMSKSLADDGYRVLVIDADIEAPSLPSQFGISIDSMEATMLGCIQYGLKPTPQQAYLAGNSAGAVDLIACKTSGPQYNLDLAMFALNTALNPSVLQDGFESLLKEVGQYDVVLVDHRSGIASSVIPLIATFPGPAVICIRLDEQSDESDQYLELLLSQSTDIPGMFVSFSLDPEDSKDKVISRSGARVEKLLEILGRCIALGATANEEEVEMRADALGQYWISWFHDRSFLSRPTPDVKGILADNRKALLQIRELAGISGAKISSALRPTTAPVVQLSNSGNTDEGLLIQTDALRKLRTPNSGYRYIFGRKGTGKTRLVRALVEENHGIPLLVAEDAASHEVISSADPYFRDLSDYLFKDGSPEKLWWIILDCALNIHSKPMTESMKDWLDTVQTSGGSAVEISKITEKIEASSAPQTFLIDGVETAFESARMAPFVQGLFRFLSLVQSNSRIANKALIRLFIRTDLVQFAAENIEQQIEGRNLILSWDTQTILNFALTRIASLRWFRESFPETITRIDSLSSRLTEGEVPVEDCSEILLEIFPTKVRRNNLLTMTFLKTYFSEGEGETASFYPRIYDAFLRAIDNPSSAGPMAARATQIEDERVAQLLIVIAHDYASKQYLNQVGAELKNLMRLANEPRDNQSRVEALMASFSGLQTPFKAADCIDAVYDKLRSQFEIDKEGVKSALDEMKRVGIFEDRPGFAGWWRAGRLFKEALGMKYVR